MRLARLHPVFLVSLLTLCLAGRGATYYVSPSGLDSNSGSSLGAAWLTINRVNSQALNPGDQVLFQGGATFNGTIFLGAPEGGAPTNPVVFSTYGAQRASINGGITNGFYAYNCAGLVISNLNFIGSGRTTNQNSGIELYNDGGGATRMLEFVRISDVDVSGFGYVGIVIGGWNGTNAYRDVRLTHADTHDNGTAGIQTYAQYPNLNTNVYVGYCRAWNNPGTAGAAGNSGNGIVLGEVNQAVIERCLAWTNGWIGDASVGIWTYDSTGVTIQFCESHHNRTGGTHDGGGFDLDGGVTGSVMQYNYSHDNDGAGYGIYEYAGAPPYSNNIVRFNISQNDGRKNSYSGIQFWNAASGIHDMEIYNNTIFISPPTSGTAQAVFFQTTVSNIHLRNNLFITSGGTRLVDAANSQPGVLFQGNDYWSSGGAFSIKWGTKTYATLAAWRTGSGQELLGTTNVGLSVDPMLVAAGGGGTVGDADLLTTLGAYQLQPYSPLREAGLNLAALFGLSTGLRDYYGNGVPSGLAQDVGAHDAALTVTLTGAAVTAGYFSASYLRSSPTRADLYYLAELSTAFSSWCTNCAVPVQTNNLGDGTELVTLRDTSPAVGAARKVLRLKVMRIP